MPRARRSRWLGALVAAILILNLPVDGIGPGHASAAALPTGFTESVAISGLTNPTNLEFASDGRVFVTEKSGSIKVFDSLSDPTPTTFTGLQTNVHNFWDRGLLGLALDPSLTNPALPLRPWVYVLYTYDHILGSGGSAPRWGDACPTPPGPTTDGCVVSGRLSRFSVSGSTISGPETVLIEDWCQQFPSHSIGDLGFGADGALYVSAGDGASFNAVDYGQFGGSAGSPIATNPCGDPPGGALTPPSAEGGALRSQDTRTDADPAGLDGAILRIDPVTGAAFAGNPFSSSPDLKKRMVIANGLRNPFRFTLRSGTNELWLGDVGWNTWEEVNRIANTSDATVEDFGWPCYEGGTAQGSYDAANVSICENLYAAGPSAITPPILAYQHGQTVTSGETCPTGSSAIAGMAFYPDSGGPFPAPYRGGLFFADHNRSCIWWMAKGSNGQPDPTTKAVFEAPAANPVDLEVGADGNLYYVDFDGGSVRQISYAASGATDPYATVMAGLSPAAYWRLGEASGTSAADSAGANTGTYAGSPTLAQPGLLTGDANTAVRFDGVNDQVAVPNAAALDPTSRLSITAWFTASAGGWDQPRNPRILQKGVNDSQYRLLVEFGLLKFAIAGVGAVTATPPSTGVRHFVAGTYDGSALRLYIDGALAATTAATGVVPTTTDALAIGNKPTSVDARDPFVGVIDEVSVHGIALSASQILQLWNSGFNGPSGGNNPPTAVASGNPTSGTVPLTVQFTGSASSDPDAGDTLTYSWDLNGDGTYGDSTAANPSFTYQAAGSFTARLRVTDNHGAQSTPASVPITVNPAGGTGSYATVVTGLGPVAYWRLGEASGTTAADSAGANSGTYGGGATLGQPGLLTGDANTAVRFDGVNDQVAVPSAAALNPTAQLTIAAWINATDWTDNPRILQKGINDSQYRLLVEGGQLTFHITGVGAVGVAPPSTGVRHFVAGSYDGTALRLYIDGALAATTVASGAIPTTTEPLAIGNKPTSVDARDPFAGVIDEVSIHALGLSAAQIGQLWTAGTTASGGNNPPTAVASGNPTSGTVPLTVQFTGSASSDPDAGDTLTYSWDLNGDGTYGDSTAANPSFTYQAAGSFTARLRVTDNHGAQSTPASVPITVNPAGGTTTLVPTADSEIRSSKSQASKNFGTLATLSVRSGSSRSYLKFTVPTLTGSIQSARLRLFVVNASSTGGSAYSVSNSWTETGITWNNAPPISGGPLGTAGAAAGGTWVEWVVTPVVSSGATVSFALSDGTADAVDYSSRTGSNPPQLVIVTGP